MSPIISIQQLTKTYKGGFQALKGIDLDIQRGEIFALLRGAITLAGVLTLPLLLPTGAAFPARDLVIFLASAVIVTSLLVASVALPRLLRGLELPEEPSDRLEEDLARRESSRAALAAVEKLRQRLVHDSEHADLYNEAAIRVSALYQRHLDHGEAMESDPEEARRLDDVLRQLRHAGLQAERQELFKLTRQRKISDEIARRLIRNLDLLEARRKN